MPKWGPARYRFKPLVRRQARVHIQKPQPFFGPRFAFKTQRVLHAGSENLVASAQAENTSAPAGMGDNVVMQSAGLQRAQIGKGGFGADQQDKLHTHRKRIAGRMRRTSIAGSASSGSRSSKFDTCGRMGTAIRTLGA